ncbi:MAG: hypothetical protein PWQ51_1928 [Methanolobus sp.]|uniref:Uncharacterized protein n=1 Tax=Methanolobus tindarius DSM 2278 TaxID=1090322 RepID=W9DQ77_METTI|nr:hypothetical protein [Methanolobus tindarius]ETA68634.1 hypothetical protein MettiDRAFT_2107 [Methanolobus tindarius DSM 2278]MDI3486471.1 hypothetical protein [Methanolobus sp.]MDK2831532.1 hypothetical protein [Methanolobus sp.]MDK2939763.1 hypothetical protein [Methanolobus sp.]
MYNKNLHQLFRILSMFFILYGIYTVLSIMRLMLAHDIEYAVNIWMVNGMIYALLGGASFIIYFYFEYQKHKSPSFTKTLESIFKAKKT